ncbi:uncharacterized protein EHS24_008553 [Apiotrichum porosum]|uniref:Uncharacterized protein n=1 Tax=Apiotrichum porosum TaxID=105984 RepID=A0A427XQK1_9TREE|nr:uncharacterized protein EHS24_008553 [Apiotrichum porosum]RSH81119.1 hypothetical protein EHS24_008553 [Apiotrichum porosum]
MPGIWSGWTVRPPKSPVTSRQRGRDAVSGLRCGVPGERTLLAPVLVPLKERNDTSPQIHSFPLSHLPTSELNSDNNPPLAKTPGIDRRTDEWQVSGAWNAATTGAPPYSVYRVLHRGAGVGTGQHSGTAAQAESEVSFGVLVSDDAAA